MMCLRHKHGRYLLMGRRVWRMYLCSSVSAERIRKRRTQGSTVHHFAQNDMLEMRLILTVLYVPCFVSLCIYLTWDWFQSSVVIILSAMETMTDKLEGRKFLHLKDWYLLSEVSNSLYVPTIIHFISSIWLSLLCSYECIHVTCVDYRMYNGK